MTAEELKIQSISYSLVTPFSEAQIQKKTTVQPDGGFKLELDYPFPYQQIWFTVGDYFYARLYANKDLYLELDMKKLKAKKGYMISDGVRYLGTDGAMNAYMNKYVIYKKQEKEN